VLFVGVVGIAEMRFYLVQSELDSSKIPLVPTTKVTHLRILLFRQSDGVNCKVRRVYSAIIAKLSQNRVVQLVDYGW